MLNLTKQLLDSKIIKLKISIIYLNCLLIDPLASQGLPLFLFLMLNLYLPSKAEHVFKYQECYLI